MSENRPASRKYLEIYLIDHHAGSTAGLELAKRCRSRNEGNEVGDYLRNTLIPEIEEDRDSLTAVMRLLGCSPNRLKDGVGWLGEKLGRFKLNGELTSYSPLSRLVEVEGLTLGVRAKRSGWQALKSASTPGGELEGVDLDRLIVRADQQEAALERLRRWAADQALA